MNFEHLVEITDPLNPLIEPLCRLQLWQGLVMRVENPMLFVMALDSCTILERDGDTLRRELSFGNLRILDVVTLTPHQETRYDVLASENFPASRLNIAIEEPSPGHLFIRFTYRSDVEQTDEMVRNHLKQAYIEADNDMAAVIRELARQGKLGDYEAEAIKPLN